MATSTEHTAPGTESSAAGRGGERSMERDTADLRIQSSRLAARIDALGAVGAIPGGGVSRLALTSEDRAGRDLVVGWMRELGLVVTIDAIGNVIGVREGSESGPPVMAGSHIDTVRTGGRYDGNLGVLAGLEVIQTLNDAGISTRRPLAVAFFTNEEGARFNPDMMGSLVYVGGLPLEAALATVGIDGESVGACLDRIGYRGTAPCGHAQVQAYLELHVEQGPVLDSEGLTIGAVEGVQGISWTEFTVAGVSNHAGTTPMRLRHDAGYVACAIAQHAREIARSLGGDQVATVGSIKLSPNLVNVIANQAVFTVDLRNTDEAVLQEAERRLHAFAADIAASEGVTLSHRSLARFEPVVFDPGVVGLVEAIARRLGHSVRRLPSGAGHDAQMLARICPAGMIFVPSVGGISHNVKEFTALADLEAGANVLLHTLLALANE
jgi:beta-ureidopropionase / N-carbamoyl-L-amino-acid hydrolase